MWHSSWIRYYPVTVSLNMSNQLTWNSFWCVTIADFSCAVGLIATCYRLVPVAATFMSWEHTFSLVLQRKNACFKASPLASIVSKRAVRPNHQHHDSMWMLHIRFSDVTVRKRMLVWMETTEREGSHSDCAHAEHKETICWNLLPVWKRHDICWFNWAATLIFLWLSKCLLVTVVRQDYADYIAHQRSQFRQWLVRTHIYPLFMKIKDFSHRGTFTKIILYTAAWNPHIFNNKSLTLWDWALKQNILHLGTNNQSCQQDLFVRVAYLSYKVLSPCLPAPGECWATIHKCCHCHQWCIDLLQS